MPHLLDALTEGERGMHLAVVSHGLFISEMIPALLEIGAGGDVGSTTQYRGLLNTAWTRATIYVKVSANLSGYASGPFHVAYHCLYTQPLDPNTPQSGEDLQETDKPQVQVTHVNVHDHLEKVVSGLRLSGSE